MSNEPTTGLNKNEKNTNDRNIKIKKQKKREKHVTAPRVSDSSRRSKCTTPTKNENSENRNEQTNQHKTAQCNIPWKRGKKISETDERRNQKTKKKKLRKNNDERSKNVVISFVQSSRYSSLAPEVKKWIETNTHRQSRSRRAAHTHTHTLTAWRAACLANEWFVYVKLIPPAPPPMTDT